MEGENEEVRWISERELEKIKVWTNAYVEPKEEKHFFKQISYILRSCTDEDNRAFYYFLTLSLKCRLQMQAEIELTMRTIKVPILTVQYLGDKNSAAFKADFTYDFPPRKVAKIEVFQTKRQRKRANRKENDDPRSTASFKVLDLY